MPKLAIAVTAAIGVVAIALPFANQVLSASASLSQIANKAQPIATAALCYGVDWHGHGYYPLALGIRRSCLGTLPYGGLVYEPNAGTQYCCDDPESSFEVTYSFTMHPLWRALFQHQQ